ncbi:MAG: hypothetical protein HYV63_28765 [Candidatus Schekmanbacteria bacterium]|nr:hypothetical protein [Candidatus Schekmanbacteria bacterium]
MLTYSDLTGLAPFTDVVQLVSADEPARALALACSFEFSPRLLGMLRDRVVPQLALAPVGAAQPGKGVLVVGTYGTGKSHLLAALSAVAELPELAQALPNGDAASVLSPLAGAFFAVRIELGATDMGLREVVVNAIAQRLAGLGIDFRFPLADAVSESKSALAGACTALASRGDGKGLLVVIDELLDYLRARAVPDLARDLVFLRELAEVSATAPVRLVAGLQESIFESPHLSGLAGEMARIRDRFVQAAIDSTDLAFVVGRRLLPKTAEQRGRVRQHLERIAPLYEGMSERLDELIDLFPLHPSFLRRLRELAHVENRHVLGAVAALVSSAPGRPLPDLDGGGSAVAAADEFSASPPGLLTFDRYWDLLVADPYARSAPGVATVIDTVEQLCQRLRAAFPRRAYLATAIRIAKALGLARLADRDLSRPVPLTAAALRDELCVWHAGAAAMGGSPAENLRTHVQTVLRLMRSTAEGQLVAATMDGDAFYLDLERVVDFDAVIAARDLPDITAPAVRECYFELLAEALPDCDTRAPYYGKTAMVELVWAARNASRACRICFGAAAAPETVAAAPGEPVAAIFLGPDEPASAVPPAGSALLVIAVDLSRRLPALEDALGNALRRAAAIRELRDLAAGDGRRSLDSRYQDLMRRLGEELMVAAPQALYLVGAEGEPKPVGESMAGGAEGEAAGSALAAVLARCFEPCFAAAAPEYPRFSCYIAGRDRAGAARDALAALAGAPPGARAAAVLDALELRAAVCPPAPEASRFGRHVLAALAAKPADRVLTREELLVAPPSAAAAAGPDAGAAVFAPGLYSLEAEWLAVVLAALETAGTLEVALPHDSGDALGARRERPHSLEELLRFRHLTRPREDDRSVRARLLEAVCKASGLAPGGAAALDIGGAAAAVIARIAAWRRDLADLHLMWAFVPTPIPEPRPVAPAAAAFAALWTTLDRVASCARGEALGSLRPAAAEVNAAIRELARLTELEMWLTAVRRLDTRYAFLAVAEVALGANHPWSSTWRLLRREVCAELLSAARDEMPTADVRAVAARLETMEAHYRGLYAALHRGGAPGGPRPLCGHHFDPATSPSPLCPCCAAVFGAARARAPRATRKRGDSTANRNRTA